MLIDRLRSPAWSLVLLLPLVAACGGSSGSGSGAGQDASSGVDASSSDTTAGAANDAAPDGSPPAVVPPHTVQGCNPIAAEWDCLFPYPSDVFRVAEGAGFRWEVPEPAWPINYEGEPVDILSEHPTDGAAILPQIVVMLPVELDLAASALPFHADPVAVSTGATSPTVLLDAETGVRVGHFSEVDAKAAGFAGGKQPLAIRPCAARGGGRGEIVALRGLGAQAGAALEPPAAFRAARDDAADGWYEEHIFGPLEAAGVERAGLQLAWDFTTSSEQALTSDMRAVVDGVVAAVSDGTSRVTITSVQDDVDGNTFRRIEGTFTVPLYVEDSEPGARLVRGDDGRVAQSGSTEASFVALIPRSVAEQPAEAPRSL